MRPASEATRVEAQDKVTGAARFAADNSPVGLLHAVLVGSPVSAGRLISIDAAAALAVPGVTHVLTRDDMPRFGKVGPPAAVLSLPMQSDEIRYEGEPIAIVLAETSQAAEQGSRALQIDCERHEPLVVGRGMPDQPPANHPIGQNVSKGNVSAALATAKLRVDATYIQASRHHNPMETSGTVARFEDGKLTMWDAVQAAGGIPGVIGAALGMKAEDVRMITPHTGGGFGCKGYVWPHQILCAVAARITGRPVKLHLTRQQQYTGTGHQPWIRQEVALGADADGTLTAIRHVASNTTAIADTFFEPMTVASTGVYASPAIETRQTLERINAPLPTPMRPPVEGPGLWALESAMNELAHQGGFDPLDLRLRNHADVDPLHGKPWSSKKLKEAYEHGAELFGWRRRHDKPSSDGRWRLGRGMATSSMGTFRFAGAARVTLKADGTAAIAVNCQDIGTGQQTICCQIAAAELGLPMERVSIAWGDSTLPTTGPGYGSSSTMHTGSAVALACREIRSKLAVAADGDVVRALSTQGLPEITIDGKSSPPGGVSFDVDGGESPFAVRSFGAIFLEVAVDPDLGLLRLRRAVGAYSAGRIINPRTARGQMIGAITWGWGKATMEESVQEPTHGRWLAKNLSNVALPVNADIPSDIQIHFVDEYDAHASAIGAKGIGELAATGVDAAVADAIHDAIGVRMRALPITPLKILEALAAKEK